LNIFWENFEDEFTLSKTKKYGVIDFLNLLSPKDKESLYTDLKNLKTKSDISIYLYINSFESDIKTVAEYLRDNLKTIYDNNANSLLAVINTRTDDIIILGGSALNKKITKQVIENMTKSRKEKLPEKKYYYIFRDIILDVIYFVGDINDPYINEDDNIYEDDEDYWQKQYEDDEDIERIDDETKEDKRKTEKIDGDEYVEVDQDKINENGYDYWKDNDDYNNVKDNDNKENENKKDKEEKKIETNKKGNGLYIFIIFLLFFVLSVIVYLYLSMKKKIKLLNSRSIDYNDIKMETKYFPPTISSKN
jgi:hypothetical protein